MRILSHSLFAASLCALAAPASAQSQALTVTPHHISGAVFSDGLAAVAARKDQLFAEARFFTQADWIARAETTNLPSQGAGGLGAYTSDLGRAFAETSFGIGAIQGTGAGCSAAYLEADDLTVIMGLAMGAARQPDIRAMRARIAEDLDTGWRSEARPIRQGAVRKHYTKAPAHHFAGIAAAQLDLSDDMEGAMGGLRTAYRFIESVTYKIYQARLEHRTPFFGLEPGGELRGRFIEATAEIAKDYYKEKSRLCRFITQQADDVNVRHAAVAMPVAVGSLAKAERAQIDAWLSGLRGEIQDAIHYPRASLRRAEEGRARVAVTVRRDGMVTGWRLVHSTGFRRLDKALQRAMRRVEQVRPFPNDFDPGLVDYEVPVEFRVTERHLSGRRMRLSRP